MSDIRYPQNNDLRCLVHFCAEKGLIWLDESRMILMHAAALAELRKELINSVGIDQARRILTRMGYASGVRDAELAKKIRLGQSLQDAFVVGPQLHMLEGMVHVSPVKLDFDLEGGHFFGEFIWENSSASSASRWKNGPTPPNTPASTRPTPLSGACLSYAARWTPCAPPSNAVCRART